MVASEVVPFAKTGGLADVAAALSLQLGRLGHQVTVVMPRYRAVGDVGQPSRHVPILLGDRRFDVGYGEQSLGDGVTVVFLDCPPLYDRPGLYADAGRDHADNAVRFALLARGAIAHAAAGGRPPSVIHAHDWQAGLVPILARHHLSLAHVPTVFTIHNIAYQGIFELDAVRSLGFAEVLLGVDGLEFWGQASFLKGGVNFSDLVTTVSQAYAREILTPEYGFGFDGIMRARASRLRGILNGIDVELWDPSLDPHLPAPFSATTLDRKRQSKLALLERYGLPIDQRSLKRPVVGMISRLVYQKGFDLVAEVIDELAATGATFVVLGTGEASFEAMWREAAARHPTQIAAQIGYDEALAHLIEGGSDLFLMPSRYEPCGLNQMYSMRYATIPVVRATGGLDDAVVQYDAATGQGTGFKFAEYSGQAMLAALRAALDVYAQPDRWRALQVAAMAIDHSWNASAGAYVRVYDDLIAAQGDEPDAGSQAKDD